MAFERAMVVPGLAIFVHLHWTSGLAEQLGGMPTRRGELDMNIAGNVSFCRADEIEGPIGEKRMWLAVLLQAVEDLRSNRISAQREAENFLFRNQEDFETVCAGAGIESSSFRARLSRFRVRSAALPTVRQLAA